MERRQGKQAVVIKDEVKHHRKCPYQYGDICRCSEIHTPPTIPRYQRQLMKQAEQRWNGKAKAKYNKPTK